MCNPASFIVTKNDVLFSKASDRHELIIDEYKLHDGYRVNFVRVEISPKNVDYNTPFSEWKFYTDQDVLPDWYSAKYAEQQVRSKLPSWAKYHLVTYHDIEFSDGKKSVTTYHGNLYFSYSEIESLPDNMVFNGNLYLSNIVIDSLPNNMTITGKLALSYSKIKSLQDNMTIVGDLYLFETKIKSRPDNMVVGGMTYGFRSDIEY